MIISLAFIRVLVPALMLSSFLFALLPFLLFAEPTSQQPEPKKLLLPPSSSDSLEELEKKLTEATSLLRTLRGEVEYRETLLKEAQEQLAPLIERVQDLQEKLTRLGLTQAAAEEQLKAKVIAELERIPSPSSGITFQSEKAKLSEESQKVLDRAVELLQANRGWFLKIEGHTDSMGDETFNLTLSQQRAESVRDYLIEKGIDPARLEAIGFGEQFPIAPNTTAEGRATNRRIVFKVITDKATP